MTYEEEQGFILTYINRILNMYNSQVKNNQDEYIKNKLGKDKIRWEKELAWAKLDKFKYLAFLNDKPVFTYNFHCMREIIAEWYKEQSELKEYIETRCGKDTYKKFIYADNYVKTGTKAILVIPGNIKDKDLRDKYCIFVYKITSSKLDALLNNQDKDSLNNYLKSQLVLNKEDFE